MPVVNSFIAKNIRDIYSLYKANKFIHLQFIPCLEPLGENFVQHRYSLEPTDYGNFLCKLFDLWCEDIIKGNEVHPCDFDIIQENRKKTIFVEESLLIDKRCKICEYLYICRGDCKRYREPKLDNKFQLNYFCESYKNFFHILRID